MKFRLWVGMLLAAVSAWSGSASAETPAAQEATTVPSDATLLASALYLKSGMVDTAKLAGESALAAVPAAASRRYVLQLDGPMDKERQAALTQAGVVLGDYIPAHAYVARLDQADARALSGLPFVRWMGPLRKEWKLDPSIGLRTLTSPARIQLAQQARVQVVVTLFVDENADRCSAELTTAGATVLSSNQVGKQWLIDAVIPREAAARLADIDAVQFVEEAPELVMRNNTNEWIVQSNISGQTPVWNAGIHGEGQLGGLIDGTMKESHCAFDDGVAVGPAHRKIVAMRDAGVIDSHGTHTAGTFAGDSGVWGVRDIYDGIAFASKLSFSNVDPIYLSPSTLYARLQDAHNDGARVHSNSWGDDGTTDYTTWCRQIDQFSYDFEESLVAFAVTNLGSLKTPENAKNVLGVGASQDTPFQNSHCSGGTGPTSDGRRKPEIYAPGCSTQSANAGTSCGVVGSTGTSMACPAVSGAGLLVRQYFTDGYYPTGLPDNPPIVPSGALIKAVLINSTEDMTGVAGYPSNKEGWGRLVLDGSLHFPGDSETIYVADVHNADGLSTGGMVTETISVTDSGTPLRITLVYTEPPAAVNAANPVINNLDLEVSAPGAVVYKGNVFSLGQSATGGSFDAKNNVERVMLNAPPTDLYSITVKGTAVNQGTQGFALVITGAFFKDCNQNGVPDDEDITLGTSLDCNLNNLPDECEADCDGDDVPDDCEVAVCSLPDPSCKDCNLNEIPDGCDIADGFSLDCNGNGAPDDCDISTGFSSDINGDALPDECCPPTAPAGLEPGAVAKNRYLSFVPGNGAMPCAYRLKVVSDGQFGTTAGRMKWVGPPTPITGIARLQCLPEVRNWSLDSPVIHVADADIVPNSSYEIQAIAAGCPLTNVASYSVPLSIFTHTLWGDVVGASIGGLGWTPPNFLVNFTDILAAVQRFQGLDVAPPLSWVDIDAQTPNAILNFSDIQKIVLAFQGFPYPFSAATPCP